MNGRIFKVSQPCPAGCSGTDRCTRVVGRIGAFVLQGIEHGGKNICVNVLTQQGQLPHE